MKTFNSISAALILLMMFSISGFSQDRSGSISGKVIDAETQNPLEDARVEIVGTELRTGTDKNGEFSFTGLEVSTYRIRVSYVGYVTLLKTDLVLYSGRPLSVLAELIPTSVSTEDINIEANYFQKNSDVNISSMNLDYEEIRRAPGAAEDISRMIQSGPGVSLSNDQRNDLIIRGGSPSENLFLIDGIEVPNINHFGSQGSSGGPIGLVNLKFLQYADIYTGGFPAVFGNKLSGVVDMKFRDGSKKNYFNNIDMSFQGFGGLFEGSFSEKSSYIFSLRRSYLDLMKDAIRLSSVPKYWDANLKLSYDLNEKNKLSLIGFWALDNIEFGPRTADDKESNPFENAKVDRKFYTAGINHKYFFRKGFLQTILSSVTTDGNTVQNNKENTEQIFRNKYLENENTLRTELNYKLSDKYTLNAGVGGKYVISNNQIYDQSDTTATGSIIPEVNVDKDINSFKLFSSVNLTSKLFGEKLIINSGVRVDYFNYINDKTNFSPRIGLSYKVSPVTSINASTGIFYQNPEYIWLAVDDFNKDLKSIRAEHFIIGAEHYLNSDIRITAEVYQKRYSDYPVSLDNPTYILVNGGSEYGPNIVTRAVSEGTGTVNGFDFAIQKKLSGNGIYGQLNYSYMKSKFKALEGGEVPNAFDQTHQATIVIGYQASDDWLIGLKYKFATGKPYTPFDVQASTVAGRGVYDMSSYNALRLPDYMRIDLRIDKKFTFDKIGLVGYIEFQNILNRENVSEYYWDKDSNSVGKILHWGFFPVGGFSLQF
ncbi:MAG: TonB-dependent receptor [Bacteroidetes bacterium]|nr:TonB-dependent receptor [Bacteroidota bacterium]